MVAHQEGGGDDFGEEWLNSVTSDCWVVRGDAVRHFSEFARRERSIVRRAAVRAVCKRVADDTSEVRDAAIRAVSNLQGQGRQRAIHYLSALLPPSHGRVWGPSSPHMQQHLLGPEDYRRHKCALLAIRGLASDGGGEEARDAVRAFIDLQDAADKKELHVQSDGGVVEVLRENSSGTPSAIVDCATQTYVWVRHSERHEMTLRNEFIEATSECWRVIPNADVCALAEEVLRALEQSTERHLQQADMIQRLHTGRSLQERIASARWLGSCATGDEAVAALRETLLKEKVFTVRCAAHEALVRLGHHALAAVLDPKSCAAPSALDRVQCHSDAIGRKEAILELMGDVGHVGQRDVLDVVGRALGDRHSIVRVQACCALSVLSTCWEDAKRYLAESSMHSDPAVRHDSVVGLKDVAMRHRGTLAREDVADTLVAILRGELGEARVKWKGLLLREVLDADAVVSSIVVQGTGEVLWRRSEAEGAAGAARADEGAEGGERLHRKRVDEHVREMGRMFHTLPALMGVLTARDSGWNGGVDPDLELLRSTILRWDAARCALREERGWKDKKKNLLQSTNKSRHVCTSLCAQLGLVDEHEEEERERKVIRDVLAAADALLHKKMIEANHTLEREFQAVSTVDQYPKDEDEHSSDTTQEPDRQESHACADGISDAWCETLRGVAGVSFDVMSADLHAAHQIYTQQCTYSQDLAGARAGTRLLPFERWYLTEYNVEKMYPDVRVARQCAHVLLTLAADDIEKVLSALDCLKTAPDDIVARAAMLFTEAKGHSTELKSTLSNVLVPEGRFASRGNDASAGHDYWDTLASRQSLSDFVPTYIHVITTANNWLDIVWRIEDAKSKTASLAGVLPPQSSTVRHISVQVPEGEYSSEGLCHVLDASLNKVHLAGGDWIIRAKYMGRCVKTVRFSAEVVAGRRMPRTRVVFGFRLQTGPHNDCSIARELGLQVEDTKTLASSIEGAFPLRAQLLPRDEWVGETMGSMPMYRIAGPSLEVYQYAKHRLTSG